MYIAVSAPRGCIGDEGILVPRSQFARAALTVPPADAECRCFVLSRQYCGVPYLFIIDPCAGTHGMDLPLAPVCNVYFPDIP